MGNEGYILTAVTEDVPSGGETGGGEASGGSQDPQQLPAGGEGGGTTAKKLVSVTVKPWNGFKAFTDARRTTATRRPRSRSCSGRSPRCRSCWMPP